MPNIDDIIWAAQQYENFRYNSTYLNVLRQDAFLNTLRQTPDELDVQQVRDILVEFLNKWLCRLRNYDNTTATNLKEAIIDVQDDVTEVLNHSILSFNLDVATNRERIERIYQRFWHYGSQIAKNFGPTCTSKTLHIINPNLFTMWDDAIRTHYWNWNNNIIDSGRGYVVFLDECKIMAEALLDEFTQHNLGSFDEWLSDRLRITPPLSLVKLIDEYNFLVYTKKITRPPDWINPFL